MAGIRKQPSLAAAAKAAGADANIASRQAAAKADLAAFERAAADEVTRAHLAACDGLKGAQERAAADPVAPSTVAALEPEVDRLRVVASDAQARADRAEAEAKAATENAESLNDAARIAEKSAASATVTAGQAILSKNPTIRWIKLGLPALWIVIPIAFAFIRLGDELGWWHGGQEEPNVPTQPVPALALLFAAACLLIAVASLSGIVRFRRTDAITDDAAARRKSLGWVSILLGADGRLSTSKIQAFLWTAGLGYVLLYLAGISAFDHDSAELFGSGNWDDYLILLGGPFAALVLAKYAVVTKLDNGTLGKANTATADPNAKGAPANPEATDIGGAITDDSGNLDIVDAQYFFFNLVAFAYFVIAFVSKNIGPSVTIEAGKYELPVIPGVLLGLTGVSAAAYVGNKAIQTTKPRINAIEPSKNVKTASIVEIIGVNLAAAGSSTDVADQTTVRLLFPASAPASTVGRTQLVGATTATPSRVTFTMPFFDATEVGTVQLAVITADGLTTDDFYFEAAV